MSDKNRVNGLETNAFQALGLSAAKNVKQWGGRDRVGRLEGFRSSAGWGWTRCPKKMT